MRVTLREFLEAMHRAREEERARVSSILAERDQDLIQKLGKFREKVTTTWGEPLEKRRDVLMFLDSLDPRPLGPENLSKRYPTMFKGGPT